MERRLDDERWDQDPYGPYDGRRSRVGGSSHVRTDARSCARDYVMRDVRAHLDARTETAAGKGRERK